MTAEMYLPRFLVGHRSRKGYIADDTVDRIKQAFGFRTIELYNVRDRSGHFYVSPQRGQFRTTFLAHYDLLPADGQQSFALVIYLTPNAPRDTGTGLYRHRATGLWRWPTSADARALGTSRRALGKRLEGEAKDRRLWEEIGRTDNVFNRAVLFPADWIHSSQRDFGGSLETAKLYQAFFFYATPDPFTACYGWRA